MAKGKTPTVSEAVARPTRTTIMYAVAVGLVVFYNDHIDHLDKQGKAVALGVALAVVNAVWVAVENRLGVGLLRTVPPKRAKVVDKDDAPPTGEEVVAGVRGRHAQDIALLQGAQAAGRAPDPEVASQVVRLHPDDLAQLAALIAARTPTPRKAAAKRPAPRD